MPKLGKLIDLFELIAPQSWAESWDNSGLLIGAPGDEIRNIMVALDPTEEVVEEAISHDANLLVTHHPLFLKPLPMIRTDSFPGRTIRKLLSQEINLFTMHTNFDRAPHGLNTYLAERLGMIHGVPIEAGKETLYKLVVFVPQGYEDKVMDALSLAGAGHLGGYSHCSFRTSGNGTFLPETGTQPFIGEIGRLENVDEVRLETIIPTAYRARAIAALMQAHPYEEVAYDLYPLVRPTGTEGLGRVGKLPDPMPWADFFQRVKELFGQTMLPVGGAEPPVMIRRFAVTGGSGGGEFLEKARRQGADVYLTGDIKYHDFRRAEELGLTLVDIGHFASESLGVQHLTQSIQEVLKTHDIQLNVIQSRILQDPSRLMS